MGALPRRVRSLLLNNKPDAELEGGVDGSEGSRLSADEVPVDPVRQHLLLAHLLQRALKADALTWEQSESVLAHLRNTHAMPAYVPVLFQSPL
jgi:hypothetical protein